MVRHGGSSAGLYLTDFTSPIPSHCVVITFFKNVPVHQLSWLALKELTRVTSPYRPLRKDLLIPHISPLLTLAVQSPTLPPPRPHRCPLTLAVQSPTLPPRPHRCPLTLAVQSPTLRKFFGKKGLRCRAYTGAWWPGYTATIFSAGVFAFLLRDMMEPCSVPTVNFVGWKSKVQTLGCILTKLSG